MRFGEFYRIVKRFKRSKIMHSFAKWIHTQKSNFNQNKILTGFGDIVPSQSSTYVILTYIIFGLSLYKNYWKIIHLIICRATMCIDLAGTEYIRKFHYLGTKMKNAKGTVMTGLKAGEYILKHRGECKFWII